MSKKSGGKPTDKAKKSPAVAPPADVEKAAAVNPAHQDAPSAPLPYPHPSSAPALWLDFAKTARRLHFLCNTHHIPLDYDLLEGVIRDCLRMLFKTIRHGDASAHASQKVAIKDCLDMLRNTIKLGRGDAKGTVLTLLNATHYGCDLLAEADTDEKSREALRAIASELKEWPVMLSPKPNAVMVAKNYLNKLGVGTKSFPPTANTRISTDLRWTELAGMLIEKIQVFQIVLRVQAENYKSPSPDAQKRLEALLPEAKKYPEVFELPETLNAGTRVAWWEVAKKILKDYWEENPDKGKTDFRLIKPTKEIKERQKTVKTMAILQVGDAFKAIAAKQ
jgi:hypothetical protein